MIINPISPELVESILPENKPISFGRWMMTQLQDTNDKIQAGENALQALAKGETDNLHHVMLRLEEAKLSLQLVEQVRSRALSAYQTLIKEQI